MTDESIFTAFESWRDDGAWSVASFHAPPSHDPSSSSNDHGGGGLQTILIRRSSAIPGDRNRGGSTASIELIGAQHRASCPFAAEACVHGVAALAARVAVGAAAGTVLLAHAHALARGPAARRTGGDGCAQRALCVGECLRGLAGRFRHEAEAQAVMTPSVMTQSVMAQ